MSISGVDETVQQIQSITDSQNGWGWEREQGVKENLLGSEHEFLVLNSILHSLKQYYSFFHIVDSVISMILCKINIFSKTKFLLSKKKHLLFLLIMKEEH